MGNQKRMDLTLASERRGYAVWKRMFDVCLAGCGLVLFAPFGLLIALAIKLTSAGPVFYRQKRVGQHGRPFLILKFRSMITCSDKLGPSVTREADPRITPLGQFLRRTKLDEAPQLWNVLVGEMSFVGPRPEVPCYVERYTVEQRQILAYKPGITDLATLVFRDEETLLRNSTDVEEFYVQHCIPRKFRLNLQYARRASFLEDVMIILETLCPYQLGVASAYAMVLALSLWAAYLLRFEFQLPEAERASMHRLGLATILIQMLFLTWRRQFAGLLSYFDVPEMKQLASGLGVAAVAQLLIWYVTSGDLMPGRSIILIDAALAFILLVALRTGLRNLRESRNSKVKRSSDPSAIRRVGIIGAGELGGWLAEQINRRGMGQRQVIVFFDDDADKWNRRLCDIPVAGMPECLVNGSWEDELDEVILAIPGASPERQQQIVSLLEHAKIRARTMPSVEELLKS